MNSFAISLLIITFVSANADSKKVSVRLGLMSGCPCTAQVCICDLSFRLRITTFRTTVCLRFQTICGG